ncbi:hypothetical protein [Agrobacterium bohemicum]|uniref:Transcriptional regulator n=1 Tax=Agrobacterium bohemicum TaxID=2052828 RepID=A0A135P716_9HYPH|nr:hypothetical protein ATO67_20515 [Agrobacterium bohemicum]
MTVWGRKENVRSFRRLSFGSNAARQSAEVKHPFEDGIRAHFDVLENLVGGGENAETSNKAMAILSLMVGAVMLSRLMKDETLSQGILKSAAGEVRRIAGRANTR